MPITTPEILKLDRQFEYSVLADTVPEFRMLGLAGNVDGNSQFKLNAELSAQSALVFRHG